MLLIYSSMTSSRLAERGSRLVFYLPWKVGSLLHGNERSPVRQCLIGLLNRWGANPVIFMHSHNAEHRLVSNVRKHTLTTTRAQHAALVVQRMRTAEW